MFIIGAQSSLEPVSASTFLSATAALRLRQKCCTSASRGPPRTTRRPRAPASGRYHAAARGRDVALCRRTPRITRNSVVNIGDSFDQGKR